METILTKLVLALSARLATFERPIIYTAVCTLFFTGSFSPVFAQSESESYSTEDPIELEIKVDPSLPVLEPKKGFFRGIIESFRNDNVKLGKILNTHKNGDHLGAALLAAQALNKGDIKPRKAKKLKPLLKLAWPYALQQVDKELKQYNDELQKVQIDTTAGIEKVIGLHDGRYMLLNKLVTAVEAIRELPEPLRQGLTLPDAEAQLSQAGKERNAVRIEGAKQYYLQGMAFLEEGRAGDKKSAQQAYYKFSQSLIYIPGYEDAETLKAEALELGTYTIAMQFSNASGSDPNLGMIMNGLVEAEFMSSGQYKKLIFLKFIRSGRGSALMEADLVLKGTISTTGVNKSKGQPISENVSRDIKVGEKEVPGDDGKVHKEDVFEKADATVTKHSKSAVAEVAGSFELYNALENNVATANTFSASYDWLDTWLTYAGNSKALSSDQRREVERGEAAYPDDAMLIRDALKRAAGNLVYRTLPYFESIGK